MKVKLGLLVIALHCFMISANAHEHHDYENQDDRERDGYYERGRDEYYDPYYDEHSHIHSRQITITKRNYTLEENFDIDSDQGHLGNVVQNSLSLRKNYTYYNHHGDLASSAYVKIPSFGSLITSATVMSVYDSRDRVIGTIEGSLMTFSPAKFYFYDANNNLKGIAYMDNDRCSFNIYHAYHTQKLLATLNQIFVRDVQDWWTVDIIDSEAIDPRVLISFGAFAVDTQAEYRKDN
jgi:hypothetical protein